VELEEYGRIADAEDSHWWYRATRALMRQMLAPWLRPGIRVLDVGCGPGGNSAWLGEYGPVTGVDSMPEAVRLARERHPEMQVSEGDATALPFEEGSFDVVVATTLLYVVDDDAEAVREIARVAAPGAAVLLIEPAIPRLRREHDDVVMTRRRYRLADLEALARGAGLEVRRSTYAYSFLVPPAVALAAAHRLSSGGSSSSDLQRDRMGRLFGPLARAERRVIVRRRVPFGLSALVLAEKRRA
jgi:ubiquinone/menaquinone biosynthesis C-methylase UbiE